MTEEPGTGTIAVAETGRGTFTPTGGTGADILDLGNQVYGVWATPTRTEVDLADSTSTPPVTTGPSGGGGGGGGGGEPVPETTEGAIARYETFLHALGDGDLDTVCEIAGPRAQVAEDQGLGTCHETFGIVVNEMIAPEQAAALRTATVDPSRVETRSTGEVFIPVEAVVADVAFGDSNLGDIVIAYQDGNWFIVE